MRLLKLLAYALFGYALYEFFRGMSDESGASRPESRGQGGQGQRYPEAQPRQRRAGQPNLTGDQGAGASVATQEADGGSIRHTVGRGVVS